MAFPYIGVPELLSGPTGIDWTSLPRRGASAQDQLAAQTQICDDVSARMDEFAEQVLRATVDTEYLSGPDFRLTVDNATGEGRFTCSRWPVLQIVSGQWASIAGLYAPGGPQWVVIPAYQMRPAEPMLGELGSVAEGASGGGPMAIMLAPGVIDWGFGRKGFAVQLTYVNGWPNCSITASTLKPNGPAAGDSSIHIDDITGWAGVAGKVYDGGDRESITATSVTPDTAGAISGPGLLNLSAALTFAHAPGLRVSAMPSSLRWAGLLLATAQALARGGTAIAAQSVRGTLMAQGRSMEELEVEAEGIIRNYGRWL